MSREALNNEFKHRVNAIVELTLSGALEGDVAILLLLSLKRQQSEGMATKRARTSYARLDPTTSCWWLKYYLDVDGLYDVEDGYKARQFRHRFRMTRPALLEFIRIAKRENWFPERSKSRFDAVGRKSVPLELLIMGSLSYLGGTVSFDTLPDVTHISSQTHRAFFDEFCEVGANSMCPFWVKPPRTEETIRAAMKAYTAAGVPGAFTSTDGVRVRMWSCSHSLRNQNIGKEGYPVRTFQVSVGSNGEIFSCTRSWDGNEPDITITAQDPFLLSIRDDAIYRDLDWEYFDEKGLRCLAKGAWSLVDNGYPDWVVLQCPVKAPFDDEERQWSEMMESLRKDVERVFGVLKQRFRVLKLGFGLQRFEAMERAFHTCCALHNYLLLRDESDLDLANPLSHDLVERMHGYNPRAPVDAPRDQPKRKLARCPAHLNRRVLLKKHFAYLYGRGEVYWPRRRKPKTFEDGDDDDE